MTKSKIFFILSLSFIGGVATSSFYYPKIISENFLLALAIFSLILIIVFYKNKIAAVIGFSILFFVFGIHITNLKINKLSVLNLNGKNFSGQALIVKQPEIKGRMQRFYMETEEYENEKFLVNAYLYPEYNYGDELKINCVFTRIENFSSDFDYRMYLAKEGVFYECKSAEIEKTGEKGGNRIFGALFEVRKSFDEKITCLIPSPESGLLLGLLVGGDERLSEEVQENFSRTGMTHIVAVSGYNVAIIAEYLMIAGIFFGLWRWQAFYLAVAGIVLFVAIIGFPSSAVRAGIMGILLIWAIKNGRLANSQNAILLSAGIMLLINPMIFRWDVGFQLSFLATIGIIYLYPFFQNYVIKKHKAFGVMELLCLTISAQIFVLPIILFNFERFALISPLANILVLPIIPLTMLLGFLSIISAFVFPPLAQVLAWLVFLPLRYETLVINFMAGLKYSSFEVSMPWWGVAIWYIILSGTVIALKKRKI